MKQSKYFNVEDIASELEFSDRLAKYLDSVVNGAIKESMSGDVWIGCNDTEYYVEYANNDFTYRSAKTSIKKIVEDSIGSIDHEHSVKMLDELKECCSMLQIYIDSNAK